MQASTVSGDRKIPMKSSLHVLGTFSLLCYKFHSKLTCTEKTQSLRYDPSFSPFQILFFSVTWWCWKILLLPKPGPSKNGVLTPVLTPFSPHLLCWEAPLGSPELNWGSLCLALLASCSFLTHRQCSVAGKGLFHGLPAPKHLQLYCTNTIPQPNQQQFQLHQMPSNMQECCKWLVFTSQKELKLHYKGKWFYSKLPSMKMDVP